MAVPRNEDILVIVQGVDLEYDVWFKPDGPLRPAASVLLTDSVGLKVDYHITISDNVALSDRFELRNPITRVLDTVTLTDSGTIGRFDYVELGYFATPIDYIGTVRSF
jgi:hypothetical protein